MEDLAEARGLVRSGNYDALNFYEDIPIPCHSLSVLPL